MVDDDVRVIELLQITLSGRGYTVHTAFDGNNALEEIGHRNPDLVVLDVQLPRMSGFQVLEKVREAPETASLPVILISGNTSNEARIQGLRKGADDYLVKPFSPRELIMKIRRILDRVADQRVLRVRNEALQEEIRRQREDLLQAHAEMNQNLLRIGSVLHRVEQLNERGTISEVYAGLMQSVLSDVGLDRVCVLRRDRGERVFTAEVWRGITDSQAESLVPVIDDFLGQVLTLEGRTMLLDELEEYPRAKDDLLRFSAAGFSHLTPVQIGGEIAAIIAGGPKSDETPLDRLDLHLLQVLARGAAGAIQSADAFDEVRRSFVETTTQLVATVEAKFEPLAGHSARVHALAMQLTEHLGSARSDGQTVSYTARLHDLGALEEYDELFERERVLSDEERADLRRRTSTGVGRTLEGARMPQVADAVYHLNEHYDGSGIPEGLVGDSIPRAARIVAVANAYDALTHARPHRPAYERDEAIRLIEERAGHQFDPEVVAVLPQALRSLEGAAVISPARRR